MQKLLCLAPVLIMQVCSNDAKTHITQSDLLQQMQKLSAPVIIDVRSGREYQAGHIPTALHIQFWNAFTTAQLPAYSSTQSLVLYCEHGPRAGIAKWGLSMQGFENIRYLQGHMKAWRKAGLPVSPANDK
ncbi:MAG: rhodanese-like domain-containing protein [Methylococcales bacterium]|nr:rhodanese-like domain-containing protein [Methylococcales bacterium]